jgi:hypothetical protein
LLIILFDRLMDRGRAAPAGARVASLRARTALLFLLVALALRLAASGLGLATPVLTLRLARLGFRLAALLFLLARLRLAALLLRDWHASVYTGLAGVASRERLAAWVVIGSGLAALRLGLFAVGMLSNDVVFSVVGHCMYVYLYELE